MQSQMSLEEGDDTEVGTVTTEARCCAVGFEQEEGGASLKCMECSLEDGRDWSYRCLDFSPVKLISDIGPLEHKRINVCCSKPLDLC